MGQNFRKTLRDFFNGPERGALNKVSPAKLRGLRVSIVSAIFGVSGAMLTVVGMKVIGTVMFAFGFIGIFVGVMLSLVANNKTNAINEPRKQQIEKRGHPG